MTVMDEAYSEICVNEWITLYKQSNEEWKSIFSTYNL